MIEFFFEKSKGIELLEACCESVEIQTAKAIYEGLGGYRHYHSFNHAAETVFACLVHPQYTTLSDKQQRILVRSALWHDAVYFTDEDEIDQNELNSAKIACAWGIEDAEELKGVILATRHGENSIEKMRCNLLQSPLEIILADADLAGLAVPWRDYSNRTHLVQKEFSQMSNLEFAKARCRWIESMLERGGIFINQEWEDTLGVTAARNLETELSMCEQSIREKR